MTLLQTPDVGCDMSKTSLFSVLVTFTQFFDSFKLIEITETSIKTKETKNQKLVFTVCVLLQVLQELWLTSANFSKKQLSKNWWTFEASNGKYLSKFASHLVIKYIP